MSTRIKTHHTTNTPQTNTLTKDPLYLQIMEALGEHKLSFQELLHFLHPDEEKLSDDLNQLVRAGIIARHFEHHHVAYALKQRQLQEAIRKLHMVEQMKEEY